ncbi:hypothetical protein Aperf_G00000052261 [Anoplocephala perfoliata]
MGNSLEIPQEDRSWKYSDSPWDLFRYCQSWTSRADNASTYQGACILSQILGFVSAYIFPLVGLLGIVSNIFITYIFLSVSRRPSRQMFYLACVSAADLLTIIVFEWIWMFPAKCLPFANEAHVYFFILFVNNYSCRIVRYLYSFSSYASSPFFLLAALDHCLCLPSIPICSHFPKTSLGSSWSCYSLFSTHNAAICYHG